MYDTQRRGRIHCQKYLIQMGIYLLADILGHGGAYQPPHTAKKFTRPGETIIIRPLTAVLIVASGGGAFVVVEGMAERVIQMGEDEDKDKVVDAEILIPLRAS